MLRAFGYALAAGTAPASCAPPSAPVDTAPACAAAAAQTAATFAVTVDFAQRRTVNSVTGFLHGASRGSPPESLVTPLRAAFWRIGTFDSTNASIPTAGIYQRLQASPGTSVQVVLSDMWGYPHYATGRWPYQAGPSGERWKDWEEFVARVAHEHKAKGVTWDVWNEPDIQQFWPQSDSAQRLFHETYQRAYRILRDSMPNAAIGGPSYSHYARDRIGAFLDYCNDAGHPCQANFLSWHELGPDIPGIAGRLRDARAAFVGTATYAAVAVGALHVNETVSRVNRNHPGAAVSTLYHLEQGGADKAARTCWDDDNGQLTCDNGSVDGLLTPGLRPRANWWAYSAYAAGVQSRVASTVSDPRFVALGSAQVGARTDQAQILLGVSSPDGVPGSTTASLTLGNLGVLPFVAARGTVRVQIWRIRDERGAAVDRMPLQYDQVHAIRDGAVTLAACVEMYDAYVVKLLPP